ncbi:sodium/hydrogen exchanger 9B2-like isoform X2 [Uloborus diversus]|uniref:sodium/hydrogen exchanger 9B2-like isoform X2 n=1 Tax=Uloborus diversus TaxID=327109 RepID=UPI00240A51A6|nr:sodium/hydrogen exchanger 9B2-like isoform X2 [Uloborus diversus]
MTVEKNLSQGNTLSKRELFILSMSSCPPLAPLSTVASLVLVLALIYGTLWGLLGPPVLPGGEIFALFVLSILAYLSGQVMKIVRVPTLVGMMILGFILRNVPHIDIAKDISGEWAGNIRNMALVLILLRAGLEVDIDVLKENKLTCSKLIFIPFIFECCAGAVASRYLLSLPWLWSFLLGFLLSAVSPAVVLPVMLKLLKKGIGTNGIPTMVILVAGICDVLALTGFEVVLGVTFSTGSLGWTIAKGPLEVLVGLVYGIVLGLISWYLPNPEEKNKNVFRFMILCFGAMFILFGSAAVDWGAAGAVGCICLPFVAAIRWKQDDWEENMVEGALTFVWRIIEPFLFGLVGSEIRIDYLQPSTVGLGLATLFIALAFRMIASLLAAWSSNFTLKEQVFVMFAGLPKATVQAAIGPVPLALTIKYGLGPEMEQHGIAILTVAVLAILITAPLGATAISVLAPRLLANSNEKDPNIKSIPETKISIADIENTLNNLKKKDSCLSNSTIGNNSTSYYIERL